MLYGLVIGLVVGLYAASRFVAMGQNMERDKMARAQVNQSNKLHRAKA